MKEEMEELCAEGVATHGDPESCVDDPVRAWRSVDRGTCRPGYRAAKSPFWGADAVEEVEGNTAGGAVRESPVGPARSKNQGMYGTFMRENRESPWPPVGVIYWRAARGTLRWNA
jgi:hypothetical protein